MQYLLIVYFVFAFVQVYNNVYARSLEEIDLEPEEEECIEELDLDRKQITRMRLEEITTDDNTKYNNFTSCFWKKMGWQQYDGEIDYSALEESLKELILSELNDESASLKKGIMKIISRGVRRCRNDPPPTGNTHGQTAVRVQNCVMNEYYRLISKAKMYDTYEE